MRFPKSAPSFFQYVDENGVPPSHLVLRDQLVGLIQEREGHLLVLAKACKTA